MIAVLFLSSDYISRSQELILLTGTPHVARGTGAGESARGGQNGAPVGAPRAHETRHTGTAVAHRDPTVRPSPSLSCTLLMNCNPVACLFRLCQAELFREMSAGLFDDKSTTPERRDDDDEPQSEEAANESGAAKAASNRCLTRKKRNPKARLNEKRSTQWVSFTFYIRVTSTFVRFE